MESASLTLTHARRQLHETCPKNSSLAGSYCEALSVVTFTEPNFVGSFDVGDYVYFFLRETSVEYMNCGKAIFARVARVCKVGFNPYLIPFSEPRHAQRYLGILFPD